MATNTKPAKLTIARDSLNRWQVTTHKETGKNSFKSFHSLSAAMSYSYSLIS